MLERRNSEFFSLSYKLEPVPELALQTGTGSDQKTAPAPQHSRDAARTRGRVINYPDLLI